MKCKICLSTIIIFICFSHLYAQKPLQEGKIVYKVTLVSADKKEYNGTYTFTFKGKQIKKQLDLNNYEETIIINAETNSAYSLKSLKGNKIAIQLNINDIKTDQKPFTGFTLKNTKNDVKKIAGIQASKGEIEYLNGEKEEIFFTNTLCPTLPFTYERFPDAKFIPLSFYYKSANNIIMKFEANEVIQTPIENSVYNIPSDYKIMSNEEYKKIK